MTDENNQNGATPDVAMGAAGDADANAPQVGIVAQYTKDLSFENPNAPASFNAMAGGQPQLEVNVNVNGQKLGEDNYEVALKISVNAKHENTNTFVVELVYAGLFGIRNVPDDALQQFLLVQAPVILFPFARRVIADATRDGGYPPLLLDPIDFGALYHQSVNQAQAGGAEGNA